MELDDLEDEIVGLRSRLARLKLSMRFINEPMALVLIKGVIADIEARMVEIENVGQPQQRDQAVEVARNSNPF